MKPFMPLTIRGTRKNPDKSARKARRLKLDHRRIGLACATIAILSVLLSIHFFPSRVSIKVGDTAPEDITAPRAAQYLDAAETELRRTKAAASVGKVYDVVPGAAEQATFSLNSIFAAVESARENAASMPVERRVRRIRRALPSALSVKIPHETTISLLSMDAGTLRGIEDLSRRAVTSVMTREIHDDPAEVRVAQGEVAAEAVRLVSDPRKAALVGELARVALRPNRTYDVRETLSQQEAAQDRVQSVYMPISSGEVVVGQGEQVTQQHLDKLRALGLRNEDIDYRSVVSLTALVTMAVLLVLAYLSAYYPDIYRSTKTLLLLSLLAVTGTLALRVSGSILGINLSPPQVGYLGALWVVAVGMLVAVLVNAQVSVVIVSMLSIVLSLMPNNEVRFAVSAFMTALVGIHAVANLRDRSDLARTVGSLAAAGVLLVWVIGGISNDSISLMRMGTFWAGLVVPIGAAAIFLIGTVPLERLFGLTTHISLLELADTNKPLLRRLVMEAPGTYTHSMAVGHLAETAAQAIGADSLMARVASYYHDIGKVKRPHFFIENQNVENAHDRINPTLSALVITSHIKDGVEIARESRLPGVVADVISQHHGTSLVQYFFDQAMEEQDPTVALESQFRYSGPKPRSKEAAIIMLADSVEAASRAMSKPTRAIIELIVNKVIADKLRDGQLDESDLTFREVGRITDAFIRALTGTLHARIDYSEVMDNRKAANGDSDPKLAEDTGEDEPDSESGDASAAG